MAYQRLDITDLKTILTAAQISHIEDGIIQNESDIADNTKIIGSKSISTIADGTLTGAVAELNTNCYKTFTRQAIDGNTLTFQSSARVADDFNIPSSITQHDFYIAIAVNANNGYVQGTITLSGANSIGLLFHDASSTSSTRSFTYTVEFFCADK